MPLFYGVVSCWLTVVGLSAVFCRLYLPGTKIHWFTI